MPEIEYLDPAIAGEGERADSTFVAPKRPHVWDYAQLKEHEHYGKYFADKPMRPWPAWIYNHRTGESKIVGDAKTAAQYGVSFNSTARFPHYVCADEWLDEPRKNQKADVTVSGKSLVTASATQAANTTAETMAQILQKLVSGNAQPELAEAISSDKEYQDYLAFKRMQAGKSEAEPALTKPEVLEILAESPMTKTLPDAAQKEILIDLAKEKNIKVDKRWSLDRIKTELDKAA